MQSSRRRFFLIDQGPEMLDVFITVDVEVWCDGWKGIDEKFPDSFKRYIYGPTAEGDFGLTFQAEMLAGHGLQGVFFVEPLFSTRFGPEPLAEIAGLLNAGQQEIQLHLHTEWVDEARMPLLPQVSGKRQHLRYFTLDEQTLLIGKGLALLRAAGAPAINAFRAGSFGFNRDTLRALAANGIPFDSSYNVTHFGLDSGVLPGIPVLAPVECDGVHEYPMTVFRDGLGKLRHAQITACSFGELEGLLWQALETGCSSFVLLSHSFEFLNQAKSRPDWVAIRRFERLCKLLDRHRDCFNVRGFGGLVPQSTVRQPAPLSTTTWQTAGRLFEQTYRRVYQ